MKSSQHWAIRGFVGLIGFFCLFLALCCAPPAEGVKEAAQRDAVWQEMTKVEAPAPAAEKPKPADEYGGVFVVAFEGEIDSRVPVVLQRAFEQAEKDKADVIVLELNTPGGELWAGFDVVKLIERSPVRVVCVVDGKAESMGYYILQACPRRLMTDRSLLMAHDAFLELPSKQRLTAQRAREYLDEMKAMKEGMDTHESRRLKISRKDFERHLARGDWYMGPKEAMQVGAVDGTISDVGKFISGMKWVHRMTKATSSDPTDWPMPPLIRSLPGDAQSDGGSPAP